MKRLRRAWLTKHARSPLSDQKDVGVLPSEFKISRQIDTYTCGSRSVFMVLRHFKYHYAHSCVKADLGTTWLLGTGEKKIRKFFESCGFHAKVATFGWTLLREVLRGGGVVVASVDGDDHYVVVHGASETHVHLADPFSYRPGRRTVAKTEFMARWDRWGIVVFPPASAVENAPTTSTHRTPHQPTTLPLQGGLPSDRGVEASRGTASA